MISRDEICAYARTWIGTHYRPGGRSLRGGLDCLGLLVMVARRFRIPHQDEPHYSSWPDPSRRIMHEMNRQLLPRPLAPLQPAMVGVFLETRLPCHTGIFSLLHGQLHVIHARCDAGVVEQQYHPEIRGLQQLMPDMRLLRVYDLPGVGN